VKHNQEGKVIKTGRNPKKKSKNILKNETCYFATPNNISTRALFSKRGENTDHNQMIRKRDKLGPRPGKNSTKGSASGKGQSIRGWRLGDSERSVTVCAWAKGLNGGSGK